MNTIPVKITHRVRMLLLAAMVMILYSCDVLENDPSPSDTNVDISDQKVYVLPNGSAYIDLYSKVKTLGTVRLNVSGQPRHGNLTELSDGFLQYSPDHTFKTGSDAIAFSIYSTANEFIKLDSIVIIVENDTTQLPCGYYPRNDSVFNVTGTVNIPVLQNDILCGDSSSLVLEVYKPAVGFPPYYGTATVTGNTIQYAPNGSFSGTDKIIYKVYSSTDTTKVGFGVVYISKEKPCTVQLNSDLFNIPADTATADSIRLYVFRNDMLCQDTAYYTFSISKAPVYGKATMQSGSRIDYKVTDSIPRPYTDSLRYKVCYGAQCKEAGVRINVH
ncbi:MAG TPA: Ig-like domain-containing protein [Ohtaekwangia sp.]|uniref:Ig-like domain-containing protein n=1 Tax=Ohtaekwangia sp. TaxID=2066019 RepID=UPI002F937C69